MTDLLQAAVEAHGGVEKWREAEAIDVTLNFWGALLDLKGFPGHFQPTVSIDTHSPRTTIQHLDRNSENRWIFTPDRVWIERPDGSIVADRTDPRSAFVGHVRETPWDQLHLTYFFGYAMWNYLTAPFLFTEPGFSTRELEPHEESGETWRRLEVTFPKRIPTHTPVQTFYFGDDFMLRRVDYTTDVLGGVAAHYTYDVKIVDGFAFPFFRRVVRRTPDGPWINGPTSFVLDYTDLHLRYR
ncbi:hypothetical protein [Nocardia sp. NPDC049707]|uniref:hypothetical protein n=1 Tax=Nocardia sp. NPDC049707 TaxID=3154735 RepID=UPI0034376ED9